MPAAGGNVQLVDSLLRDVPVCYNAVATQVSHTRQGVTVTTKDAVYHGATL